MKDWAKRIVSFLIVLSNIFTWNTLSFAENITWPEDDVKIQVDYDNNILKLSGEIPIKSAETIAVVVFEPNKTAVNLETEEYYNVIGNQRQFLTNEDGTFDEQYLISGDEGVYNIVLSIKAYNLTLKKSYKFAINLNELISNFNMAKTEKNEQKVEQFINEAFARLDMNCENYDDYVSSGKPLGSFYKNIVALPAVNTISDIIEQIDTSIMYVSFKNIVPNEVEQQFEKYAVKLGISNSSVYETYKNLDTKVKNPINSYFAGKDILINENIKELFIEKVIIEAINYAVSMISYGDIKYIVEKNAAELSISLDELNKLKYPENAYKELLKRQYQTISDFKMAFSDAVNKQYSAEHSNTTPSPSGGGGGGGGGGIGAISTTPSVSNNNPSSIPFNDLENYAWAKSSVERLYNMGIVSGKGNDIFDPSAMVTREEFLKMLVGAANIEGNDSLELRFKDVDKNAWYFPYISKMFDRNIIHGVSAEYFGIGENILRQDMATMIYRVAAEKNLISKIEINSNFIDFDMVSEYAKEAVSFLEKAGLIAGMGDGTFSPRTYLSRAEAAVVISRLIDYIEQ